MPKRKVDSEDLIINGFDLRVYRKHPRIVELRVLVFFNLFVKEYGMDKATNFFRDVCALTNTEWNRISGIINSFYQVMRLQRANERRYRQEVILMGLLWGDARLYSATHFLGISRTTLYTKDNGLNPEDFIDQAWLNELSNEVEMCGQEAYKIEAIRFLEALHRFGEVLGYVSVPD